MTGRARALCWLLALAAAATACQRPPAGRAPGPDTEDASPTPYRHDRRDYLAFRTGWPDLLEPNYLPFMTHRIPGADARGDLLVFCRWPADAMPLRYYVDEIDIPEALRGDVRPVDPAAYAEAVALATRIWEAELEGLVTFERVMRRSDALIRFRVLAEPAPSAEPEVRVLGATRALRRACRSRGWHPDAESLNVSFEVTEATLYAADEFGLLTPAQVQGIAMHEIGHLLGMLGHSPVPGDLMYRVLGERRDVHGLSEADVNTFVSAYHLPNGTVYATIPPDGASPPPLTGPPTGDPQLSVAPYVDARFGFELHTPAGWLRVAGDHGLFAANGPMWDYDASLEIFVWPSRTIEEFLGRFGESLFRDTWRRDSGPTAVVGLRAFGVSVDDPSGRTTHDFLFVEMGDARVMMILASTPADQRVAWRPWIRAALASLEIWPQASDE